MKNMIKQVFHSPKFVVGFVMFMLVFLTVLIYPLIVTGDPLEMIGNGAFFEPGTYVNVDEVVNSEQYKLHIDAKSKKIEKELDQTTRNDMKEWLVKFGGVDEASIDTSDATGLLKLWQDNYSADIKTTGLTAAKQKYYKRLAATIDGIVNDEDLSIAEKDSTTGELKEKTKIASNVFAHVSSISNRKTFILGTDNFGRDVLSELVAATKTSLQIGFAAGIVATLVGLLLGLIAGYVGGIVDDIIMFITNLFTVIPSFVILILISYSIGNSRRGVGLVAVIIGITSWTWTTRSVRSQVISLRNRDHVNLSKLSGHSMFRIMICDILPYIASYVVMAFILQISTGILSEAQLSMLGLGPSTTKNATLGLMMNWAMQCTAYLNGKWWAYFPVILVIAIISFSLNLMNTGLDQVFNPQLRD
ncbi:MAG: ABC transporter permease [bacterium]|nr:ABC transporter permease [bacterium]